MKHIKKLFLLTLFLGALQFTVFAQHKGVVFNSAGNGSASSNKVFKKVIRLVDANTQKPIPGISFLFVKNNMAIFPGLSNKEGYATIFFRMANYYNKVEIEMADSKYNTPENRKNPEDIAYRPVNNIIKFPSKKEVQDTVQVLMRKTSSQKDNS